MHDLHADLRTIPSPVPDVTAPPVVEIAVPVFNEEHVLEPSIERLHAYLSERFPFSWRITIVDTASTDGTWIGALRLARELPNVTARHLDRKGRGVTVYDLSSPSATASSGAPAV